MFKSSALFSIRPMVISLLACTLLAVGCDKTKTSQGSEAPCPQAKLDCAQGCADETCVAACLPDECASCLAALPPCRDEARCKPEWIGKKCTQCVGEDSGVCADAIAARTLRERVVQPDELADVNATLLFMASVPEAPTARGRIAALKERPSLPTGELVAIPRLRGWKVGPRGEHVCLIDGQLVLRRPASKRSTTILRSALDFEKDRPGGHERSGPRKESSIGPDQCYGVMVSDTGNHLVTIAPKLREFFEFWRLPEGTRVGEYVLRDRIENWNAKSDGLAARPAITPYKLVPRTPVLLVSDEARVDQIDLETGEVTTVLEADAKETLIQELTVSDDATQWQARRGGETFTGKIGASLAKAASSGNSLRVFHTGNVMQLAGRKPVRRLTGGVARLDMSEDGELVVVPERGEAEIWRLDTMERELSSALPEQEVGSEVDVDVPDGFDEARSVSTSGRFAVFADLPTAEPAKKRARSAHASDRRRRRIPCGRVAHRRAKKQARERDQKTRLVLRDREASASLELPGDGSTVCRFSPQETYAVCFAPLEAKLHVIELAKLAGGERLAEVELAEDEVSHVDFAGIEFAPDDSRFGLSVWDDKDTGRWVIYRSRDLEALGSLGENLGVLKFISARELAVADRFGRVHFFEID